MRLAISHIPPDFGCWLAGFADGEGCFQFRRVTACPNAYQARFEIGLRIDDLPVLKEIRRVTRLGRIDLRAARPERNIKASAHWLVLRKAECLAIAELFEAYPLRAKKARDFAIWAEAVREWHRSDYERMAVLQAELLRVRTFNAEGDRPELPGSPQLRLVG